MIERTDSVLLKATGNELRHDVFMKCSDGTTFSVISVEHQSTEDYAMVTRIMEYDATRYNHEYKIDNNRRRENLHPHFSLVLFTGKGKWGVPTELYDLVDVPEELKEYVSNYKIRVIPIEFFDEYTSTGGFSHPYLQYLCRAVQLIYRKDKEALFEEFEGIRIKDWLIHLMGEIVNDDKLKSVNGEGESDMCELMQEIKQDGKQEIILNLLKSGLSVEWIYENTKEPLDFIQKIYDEEVNIN